MYNICIYLFDVNVYTYTCYIDTCTLCIIYPHTYIYIVHCIHDIYITIYMHMCMYVSVYVYLTYAES